MKTLVLSLGGSIIVPDKVNIKYLEQFRSTLRRFYKTHKFVIVCGGGSIARKYIDALKKDGASYYEQSMAGCRATKMNALMVMQIFGKEANDVLPTDIKHVVSALHKNHVVVCGALRYAPNSTSDGTAAKIANHLKSEFINMTNVKGLYDSNPKENKDAKFISSIGWKEFEKMALSMKHTPGQHFVLDQEAAVIIRKHSITTHIISEKLGNFTRLLGGKRFVGTTISD